MALGTASLVTSRVVHTFSSVPTEQRGRLASNAVFYPTVTLLFALLAPSLVPLTQAYISSFSPSAPSPFGTSFAPLHPAPAYPINILSSVQSTTGLIVVGEIHAPANNQLALPIEAVRFLRASHSLLGGVWIDDKVHTLDDSPAYTDGNGTPLGDSIYAAFVLQEAVRLNAAVDAKNALVM